MIRSLYLKIRYFLLKRKRTLYILTLTNETTGRIEEIKVKECSVRFDYDPTDLSEVIANVSWKGINKSGNISFKYVPEKIKE